MKAWVSATLTVSLHPEWNLICLISNSGHKCGICPWCGTKNQLFYPPQSTGVVMNLGFLYDLCSKLSCPCEAWPQTPFFPSLLRNPRTWDFPFSNPWELIFEICRWWSFICFFSPFFNIYIFEIFFLPYTVA